MNRGDKKKEQQLQEQQSADRALFLQSYNAANKPSALQSRLEEGNLDYLDWESGKGAYEGKPLDVMSAPGLGPQRSLYAHAKAGQQGERAGIGALRMGLNASDPGLAANLAEQNKLRREQDAAGALEQAVAVKSAEARGSSLPLIGLDQSRRMGLAGMAGNQSGQSAGLWAGYRPRPGFFNRLGGSFADAAGEAGAKALFGFGAGGAGTTTFS